MSEQPAQVRTDAGPQWAWLVWPGVAGSLAGVCAKFAELVDGPLTPLGTIGSFFGPWVVLVLIFAYSAPSRLLGAMGGSVLLLAALIGYYATYAVVDGNVDLFVVAFWAVAALTAGPLLAALVTCAGQAGPAGAVAVAFPVGLLLGEAARAAMRAAEGGAPARDFSLLAAFDLVAGILILLRLSRRSRTRTAALTLLPAFAAVGFLMSDLPRWFVVVVLGSP